MSGAITLSIALLVAGMNTPTVLAVINNVLYHKVGTVKEGISNTFYLYEGVSKVRCLAICSERKCPIVAWGIQSSGSQHCHVLSGAAVSTSVFIPLRSTTGILTVYVPINSKLVFIQKPYALLLHISGSYSWSQTRVNCRNKGIGLYTPTSISIIGDLVGTYGSFWTGTSDISVEGTYRSEDGTTVAVPGAIWCTSEPNNSGSVEDCIHTSTNNCFNDKDCSHTMPGLCIVGK